MTHVLSGVSLDVPVVQAQVRKLAQQHHQRLHDVRTDHKVHLGQFLLQQQSELHAFTHQLSKEQEKEFYHIYRSEMNRLAKEQIAHDHAEHQEKLMPIFVALVIVALGIYFTFVPRVIT